ncbi:MAG: TatD family hydrolase [Candidatus Latescibacteria bacterium]|jgi:TatD DNase family protein|nr:TatD family hydrolase [Candidatus Latescibacterota bacterium]
MLIDTHAHLDFDDFNNDRDEVIERAHRAGISHIINPGCNVATSQNAVLLSETYDMVYAAVGIHPNSTSEALPGDNLEIARLAEHPRVVAIGETGLDFYRDRSPRDIQMRAFSGQLELARELDLPVIIHFRNVEMDGIESIGQEKLQGLRGVFHCFGGSSLFARTLVSWGFYIGFNGPLTFKGSDRVEVARVVPLESCLIETDAPFLTPQRYRGSRNEPAYVREVAEKLAIVKKVEVEEVIEVTGKNARVLFGLDG